MKERWDEGMDERLKKAVREQNGVIDWKLVRKEIGGGIDGIEGKKKGKGNGITARQCEKRQDLKLDRWYKIGNDEEKMSNWTHEEELLLLEKQNQIGNKWSQLKNIFQRRQLRNVKNQFYSLFRRAIRKINRQIYVHKGNTIRPITNQIILKILATDQQKFNSNQTNYSLLKISSKLKHFLIQYSHRHFDSSNQHNSQKITQFLEYLNDFRLLLKTKKPPLFEQLFSNISSAQSFQFQKSINTLSQQYPIQQQSPKILSTIFKPFSLQNSIIFIESDYEEYNIMLNEELPSFL